MKSHWTARKTALSDRSAGNGSGGARRPRRAAEARRLRTGGTASSVSAQSIQWSNPRGGLGEAEDPGHLPLAALAPFGEPVRFFFPTGSPPRALRPLPPLDVPTPGSQVRRGASAPDKARTVLPFSGRRKLNYPSTVFRQLFVLFCGHFDVRKGSEGNPEKLEPRLQVGRQ